MTIPSFSLIKKRKQEEDQNKRIKRNIHILTGRSSAQSPTRASLHVPVNSVNNPPRKSLAKGRPKNTYRFRWDA